MVHLVMAAAMAALVVLLPVAIIKMQMAALVVKVQAHLQMKLAKQAL